jgi:hypothetical protein
VIVHNLHVAGTFACPIKTDSPLVVDSNAELAGTIAFEHLQAVPRRRPQIVQPFRGVKDRQLSPRRALNRSKPPNCQIVEEVFSVGTAKALDHASPRDPFRPGILK